MNHRLVATIGAVLGLGPLIRGVITAIGLAGMPDDLKAWGQILSTVVVGYTVFDWALLVAALLCLAYAVGLWPNQLTLHRSESARPAHPTEPVIPDFAQGAGMLLAGRNSKVIGLVSEGNAGPGYVDLGENNFAADVHLRDNNRRNAPTRDRNTGLGEALGYAIFGEWGNPLSGLMITIPPIDYDNPIEQFRKAALAGKLRVWGRREPRGLIEPIDANFWEDNTIAESGLRNPFGAAQTVPFEGVEAEDRYHALMVNRAEVEKVWPHAG